MKSAHEICGCLDGVRCALTADRDRLMGLVNSAENRARLAEDREELLKAALLRIAKDATGFFENSPRAIAWAALDAQETRT
jgi:hypothetical protein